MTEPRFDGCEVQRQLRSGPATDWYMARQTSVRRSVVIKSLSPQLLPESPFAAPLEREAQLLAQLQHKNIVQLFDFKKSAERMWLLLEYIDGWTLEELLSKVPRLGVPCALAITREVVVALDYVHQRGIVHRDVRPRNILISRRGDVKLTNFYLAAEAGSPLPPELLEGDSGFPDLSYMSPEQILGETTDARSDFFSVGVVLYQMVSGQRPFDADDNRTTAHRIRHDPPTPLAADVVAATPLLERLLQRLLSKLPSDRFLDTKELLLVLDNALAVYGEVEPDQLIRHGLSEQGVVEATNGKAPSVPRQRSRTLDAFTSWVYVGCLVAFLLGIVAIWKTFGADERTSSDEHQELPLVPPDAAEFRAVVRPWAHVFIDGQKVETTPFAHPIPLQPGVHYVRFEHPNAEPVHRRIDVSAGQSVFVEIDMPLPKSDPLEVDEDALLKAPRTPDGGYSP